MGMMHAKRSGIEGGQRERKRKGREGKERRKGKRDREREREDKEKRVRILEIGRRTTKELGRNGA